DLGLRFLDRPTDQPGVEIIARRDEGSRGQPERQLDDAVLDEPVLGHQHYQCPARSEIDELQVLQRALLLWDDHNSGAMRETRERARRLFQRLGEALAAGDAKALDAALLILGKAADLEQAVNKQPQTGLGRQSPGRGVG